MNNKEKLFKLQEYYLASRSKMDFSTLMVEIEKLTKMILNTLLIENSLYLPVDRREVVMQTALEYMAKKYIIPDFKVDISFYSLIRLHLIGALFDQEARKEKRWCYLPPNKMAEIMEGEYIESIPVMSVLLDELERRPELKKSVFDILDSGRRYETQLYKIKPKALRLKVKEFMVEMKEKIYVTDEYL